MKISRVSIWILGGTALTALLVVFGSWNWRLHCESELRLGQAKALENRGQSLSAKVAAGTEQKRVLLEALGSASNRINELEKQLEAEKKTHDPLRHQIEEMLVAQISLKDNLSKREQSVGDLNKLLNVRQMTNEELRVQVDGQRDRIAKLETDLKGASEREAAVQLQLGAARNSATDLKAKLEETQRHLAESEHLAGELQKQKQAVEAAMATNLAATVSSP